MTRTSRPSLDQAITQVRRTDQHTEFVMRYQSSTLNRDREEAVSDNNVILRVRRVFHPVRGEEVQVDLEVGRTLQIKGRRDGATRYDARHGTLIFPPDLADDLIATIQGKPRK